MTEPTTWNCRTLVTIPKKGCQWGATNRTIRQAPKHLKRTCGHTAESGRTSRTRTAMTTNERVLMKVTSLSHAPAESFIAPRNAPQR